MMRAGLGGGLCLPLTVFNVAALAARERRSVVVDPAAAQAAGSNQGRPQGRPQGLSLARGGDMTEYLIAFNDKWRVVITVRGR
jgi:hypothetical protein